MSDRQQDVTRHLLYLSGFWVFAILATVVDNSVGPDDPTFHLIGVAAGVSIAWGVLMGLRKRGAFA